jgi:hypothetical protein
LVSVPGLDGGGGGPARSVSCQAMDEPVIADGPLAGLPVFDRSAFELATDENRTAIDTAVRTKRTGK